MAASTIGRADTAEDPFSRGHVARLFLSIMKTVGLRPFSLPPARVSAHVDVPMPSWRWDDVDVPSTLWFRHSVATVKGLEARRRIVPSLIARLALPMSRRGFISGLHIIGYCGVD